MPALTVRAQLEHARTRLAQGDARGAVTVCRRVLETYPRCVRAYVVLGEALLALGWHARAEEAFRRAWSVLPTDPAVRAGLARARSDHPGDEAALSRVELALLWLRQGLHARAVRELRALVSSEPERYDAQVALLEALWRCGSGVQADLWARAILARHPFCLAALLIAGALGLHGERDAQARAWLLSAQELDPENSLAQDLLGERSPLPPRTARLPFRDEDAPPLDLAFDDEEPEPADGAPLVTWGEP